MIKLYQLGNIPLHAHIQKNMNNNLKARGKHIDIQDANFVYLADSPYIVEPVTATVEMTLFHNGIISATQQANLLKGYIGHIVDAIGYVNAMGEGGGCCGGRNVCPCESCCKSCCCLIWFHNFLRVDSIEITETNQKDIATVKMGFTLQQPYWKPINKGVWRYVMTSYNEYSTSPEVATNVPASQLVNIPPTCRSFGNPCGSFTRVRFDSCDVLSDPIYFNEFYCSDYSDLSCRDFKEGGGIGWYRVSTTGDGYPIHVNKFIFDAPSSVVYQFRKLDTVGRIRIRVKHPSTIVERTDELYIDLAEIDDIATRNSVTINPNDILVLGEGIESGGYIRDNATGNVLLYVGSAIRRTNNWHGQFMPGLNFISVTPIESADRFEYSILYTNRSF